MLGERLGGSLVPVDGNEDCGRFAMAGDCDVLATPLGGIDEVGKRPAGFLDADLFHAGILQNWYSVSSVRNTQNGVWVKVQRVHVARLYPAPEQAAILDEQAHTARALWNLLHEWWTWGGRYRRPTPRQADEAIRQARKDIDWLSALPAQAAQQVLKQYQRAWKNFFEGRAKPPTFKSRSRARMAIDLPQAAHFRIIRLSEKWGELTVIKVGRVRFRWTRDLGGRLTGARLVKDAFGWHIVLRLEFDAVEPVPHAGPPVGIDRGVNIALALSDGDDKTHGPWLRPKEAERLLRLERKSARQRLARKRGEPVSNRLRRTYNQIAKVRAIAKRRRSDWQHKTTTAVAGKYGLVVVEDLPLRNMTRSAKGTIDAPGKNVRQKAGLNRSMLDEGHGRIVDLLAYKVADRGASLVKVPAPGTSQTCHQCKHRDPSSRKGIVFRCTSCGWAGHADTNAALNILAAGLAVTGRGAFAVGRGCEASTTRGAS